MGRLPPVPRALFLAVCVSLLVIANGPAPSRADNLYPAAPSGPCTFRVLWDGHEIPGVTTIAGLARRTEVIDSRAGGDPNSPRRSPGASSYEPIVLKRTMTQNLEFERWANKVWNYGSGLGAEVSLRDFRKDIRIEVFDENGHTTMAFNVYRCWPSDHVVLDDLDLEHPASPTESLILQYEGWERDMTVGSPH